MATQQRVGETEVRAWLKSRGVNALQNVYDFPIDQIDEKASRANQARPTALVDEAVERYVVALKNGAEFPPVVGYFAAGGTKKLGDLFTSKAKVTLIDGNNREASFKKVGRHTIPLILIATDTPSELITLLTVEANARHGQAVEVDWRVRQAIHLHEGMGHDLEVACSAALVSVGVVRKRMTVTKSEVRAKALGLAGYSKLSISTKYKLAQIKDDAPFVAASKVVMSTGMVLEELAPFMRELHGLSSEADRMAFIAKTAEEQKILTAAKRANGRAARISSPKNNLATAIGKIMSVDTDELVQSLLRTVERDELARRLDRTADKLVEIQVAVLGALKDNE